MKVRLSFLTIMEETAISHPSGTFCFRVSLMLSNLRIIESTESVTKLLVPTWVITVSTFARLLSLMSWLTLSILRPPTQRFFTSALRERRWESILFPIESPNNITRGRDFWTVLFLCLLAVAFGLVGVPCVLFCHPGQFIC